MLAVPKRACTRGNNRSDDASLISSLLVARWRAVAAASPKLPNSPDPACKKPIYLREGKAVDARIRGLATIPREDG
jgi:hypothetical protein